MGFLDGTLSGAGGSSGFNSLRDNPVSNFLFGKPVQPQPGVGGPAANPERLVRDPVTGAYFDPSTGTSYTDPDGNIPIANPNIAQQVAQNFQRSQAFLNQLTGLEQQRQQVFGEQNQLGDTFRNIISGNTPSAAGIVMQQGLDRIADDQLSQAAGVGGASAPLASAMAARNTANAGVNVANQAALAKMQEQQAAMNALNSLLGVQAQGAEAALGRTTNAAGNFANLASSAQQQQQNLNTQVDMKRAEDEEKFGASTLKFFGSLFG